MHLELHFKVLRTILAHGYSYGHMHILENKDSISVRGVR